MRMEWAGFFGQVVLSVFRDYSVGSRKIDCYEEVFKAHALSRLF